MSSAVLKHLAQSLFLLHSNLDIREAILQLLGVIRNGNTKFEQHSFKDKKLSEDILDRIDKLGGQRGTERKIDNISTFLLRYERKCQILDQSTYWFTIWVVTTQNH